MSTIYYIYNNVSCKGYIGSTKNFERRKYEHLLDLLKNRHRNRHLQSSYNMYGKDSFIITSLINCPEEYQYKLEQWFLDKSSLNKEYNICNKVKEPPRYEVTEEIRLKLKINGQKNFSINKEKMLEGVRKLWNTKEHRKFMHNINSCENHPQTVLTNNIVREIKNEIFNIPSYYGKRKDICEKYGITINIYKDIQRKKTWKYV